MATSKKSKTWGLLGVPDDRAVSNVGGRVGAALGPQEFRRQFLRMVAGKKLESSMRDFGLAQPMSGDIVSNHAVAALMIERATVDTDFTVIVGGSHDHAYSHLRGVWTALGKPKSLGCINVDAHLDVRPSAPLVTSGSGFFIALESGTIAPKNFVEFGIQTHCNGPQLWEYVKSRKIKTAMFEDMRHGKGPAAFAKALKTLAKTTSQIVISFDIDACAAAFAPGVSAAQAEGFSASEAVEMAEIAGREKKVISLGLFELNPLHDHDHRTSLLAATMAYHFAAARLKG